MMNAVDQCPNTQLGEIIDGNGCSLSQLDTDGDGVNDLDAFPKIVMNQLILIATACPTDWMLILRMHCVQRLRKRTIVTDFHVHIGRNICHWRNWCFAGNSEQEE